MDFPRPLSSAHQPRHYSHHHLLLPLLLLSILRACTAQLLVEENAGIAYPLSPRATTVAAPIGFSPDQNWDGIDGQWSSFTLAIGSPQQFVRTFVSTASQQIWAIDPIGCKALSTTPPSSMVNTTDPVLDKDCVSARGQIFNSSASSSYTEQGLYSLWIEQNLGYQGNAYYGFDTITLGNPGEGGPTVENMVIGHLGVYDFYLGIFGVNAKPTNFTNFTDGSPSFISTMFEDKRIPSNSFGYTAGAPYRFSGILASLTFGGYDSSRFIPSNQSFIFAADNERDLVVSLNSVTTSITAGSFLTNPIYTYIDSTVPQIWLPIDACQRFEQAFGITYDETTDLYFVNDTQHTALLAENANITFTIAQLPTSNAASSVQIVMPYKAFDHTAKSPYRGLTESKRYFPLRRAHNESQYTLGRAFLQESYLIVDWERRNFSVNPIRWEFGVEENLVAILSPSTSTANGGSSTSQKATDGSGGIGTGAIVGIVVGVIVLLVAGLVGAFFWRQKRRQQGPENISDNDSTARVSEDHPPLSPIVEPATNVIPKVELDATPTVRDEKGNIINLEAIGTLKAPDTPTGTYMSGTTFGLVESDAQEREIYEMPGDMPPRQEADGTQLTEKQAMMRREEIYNGATPSPTYAPSPTSPNDAVSPISPEHRRVHPHEIVQIGPAMRLGEEGTVSSSGLTGEITPITEPRDPNRRRFSYEDFDD